VYTTTFGLDIVGRLRDERKVEDQQSPRTARNANCCFSPTSMWRPATAKQALGTLPPPAFPSSIKHAKGYV
jgi:hypothetical protein